MATIGEKCECLFEQDRLMLIEALSVYLGDAENTLRRLKSGELRVGGMTESIKESIEKDIPKFKALRDIVIDMRVC